MGFSDLMNDLFPPPPPAKRQKTTHDSPHCLTATSSHHQSTYDNHPDPPATHNNPGRSKRVTLLTLPPEIRVLIYRHLFHDSTLHLHHHNPTHPETHALTLTSPTTLVTTFHALLPPPPTPTPSPPTTALPSHSHHHHHHHHHLQQKEQNRSHKFTLLSPTGAFNILQTSRLLRHEAWDVFWQHTTLVCPSDAAMPVLATHLPRHWRASIRNLKAWIETVGPSLPVDQDVWPGLKKVELICPVAVREQALRYPCAGDGDTTEEEEGLVMELSTWLSWTDKEVEREVLQQVPAVGDDGGKERGKVDAFLFVRARGDIEWVVEREVRVREYVRVRRVGCNGRSSGDRAGGWIDGQDRTVWEEEVCEDARVVVRWSSKKGVVGRRLVEVKRGGGSWGQGRVVRLKEEMRERWGCDEVGW